MAVYGINGNDIMDDVNTINEYLTLIFKETGRANLLSKDLKKWGNIRLESRSQHIVLFKGYIVFYVEMYLKVQ